MAWLNGTGNCAGKLVSLRRHGLGSVNYRYCLCWGCLEGILLYRAISDLTSRKITSTLYIREYGTRLADASINDCILVDHVSLISGSLQVK